MLQKTYMALKKHASKWVEPWDESLADCAFELAFAGHSLQFRKSGEAYIFHPIEVARIVASLRCDLDTFLAAILHDVLEDTDIRPERLTDEFGEKVSQIVEAVTKISEGEDHQAYQQRTKESLRKVIIGSAENLRVAYIKLADRLHNLTTLEARPPQRRTRTIEETRQYLAPLARELGIGFLYRELSYWAHRLGTPDAEKRNSAFIAKHQGDYRRQVGSIWDRLASELYKEGIVGEKVEADLRYSLAEAGSHDTQEAWFVPYDLTLVFESAKDCYAALGILHSHWPPISSRYGDWLAIPLPNGYAAIHTAILARPDIIVNIRLQSEDMHRESEWGPLFRLRGVSDYEEAGMLAPHTEFLKQIAFLNHSTKSTERFLEYLRLDALRPKVRVFTEDGLTHIPELATVLDLAYYKSTEAGHKCGGALVNDERVDVDAVLHEGDIVKLLLKETAAPEKHWRFLRAFTTATAKYAILEVH